MSFLSSRLAALPHRMRGRALSSSSAPSNYDTFHRIAMSRASEFDFDSSKTISPEVMRSIVRTTQAAPSSFNFQPYKIVLVSARDLKEVLARTACLGFLNTRKVLNCSVLAVFLSDKVPSDLTDKVVALEAASGADPEYVRSLPQKTNFLIGKGVLAGKLKRLATHLLSPLQASPGIPAVEAWSEKNTTFAAQNYMLAATSLGISTCPMEGFDARRVTSLLEIPEERYSVPYIIATGYPALQGGAQRKKVRFPMEDVVFKDKFGCKYSD